MECFCVTFDCQEKSLYRFSNIREKEKEKQENRKMKMKTNPIKTIFYMQHEYETWNCNMKRK